MKFGQWLGFICLIMALYVLWQIRQLLLLIFMAIVFTVALNRCVKGLQRLGIKRGLAILITLLTSLAIVILFFIIIVPPFIEQFQKLIELLPQAWDLVRNNSIQWRQKFQFDWLPSLPNLTDLVQQLQPLGTFVFSNFFTFFSNSIAAILQLLFVLVLAMMMLANPQPYRQAFLKLFPHFYRRRAEEILTLSEAGLGNWLLGIAISSTMVGLFSGFGLFVLQINLVLVHAILAGLLNFIPNIGPTASVIFPILIAVIDAPWKIVAILILYFIIQNVESYLLTPTVMAKQVSLLPAITLIAQIFFAQMFGILGLLLALPLTVVVKTWLDELLFKDILDQWDQVHNKS
ncbi:MAG: AI-2E family transporter [Microcystis wesenbergii Mw_MB_S_20031200_S109]|uniref:AI-2E family transporter n=1 Tax=Microcystis wesenbergii Mw_MB_S_20031200_S109D TaxID=2486241 RepID=A0A552LI74_9CHRO|nr:MAG: AI-2E family transporter [Microcystis wesenbergii Mw_MB_S_20031200_S109]TRV19902.1 MAG: AI-2E family transporter [Microcystis wesenbergii Mw_MB_S_20031200_S109D]